MRTDQAHDLAAVNIKRGPTGGQTIRATKLEN